MNIVLALLLASPVLGAPAPDDSSYKALAQKAIAAEAAGDCGEAERQFAAAAKEAGRLGSGDARAATAWSNLGGVQDELDEPASAEESYRRARAALAALAAAKSSDHGRIGAAWHNIGLRDERAKRRQDAEKAFKNAIAEFKKIPDLRLLGQSYHELANTYNFMDRDAEAETLYRKAVKILSEAHANSELNGACTNQAFFFSFHRRMPEAYRSYRCALVAADASIGLIKRSNRALLVSYAKDLRESGLVDDAKKIEALIAKIDALPAAKPGACQKGRVSAQY